MLSIAKTNGDTLSALEFSVGNGYGALTQSVWIRAYNNGSYTGYSAFYSSIAVAQRFTVATSGTDFDEVRVQASLAGVLDPNGAESQYGAVAIDDVVAFGASPAAVPEPASLAMWGAGAIGAFAIRRRRQNKSQVA